MLSYVPLSAIDDKHLECILRSVDKCPEAIQVPAKEILEGIAAGTYTLFDWDGGCIVVGTHDKRLEIVAFSGGIFLRQDLAADLKRLAADWECDTIETRVFDPRLASAITKIGGQVESYMLTLAVKE
jgi:hypothetical protein